MTGTLTAASTLRGRLLQETVAWCRASSEFYRGRFAHAGEINDLGDIVRLPVLTREDVTDNHAALRCDGSLPAAVQHTTGTTGAFLQVYRGANEQAFVWQFMAAQAQQTPLPSPRPLHLVLANAYHGALTPMPTRAYVMSVGVHDRAQASQARQVLETTYDLADVAPRVSVVSGTERMVKALTAYLVADGFDLAASPVRRVDLFGGHVTPRVKALLGRLWNADVTDHYSLTEMFGGASEVGVGGPWIFDPHVIAEAVHPRTYEPVTVGEVGVLLLTSLYPFTQAMPLIRYVTGDLVRVVAPADAPGGLQVRYLGRTARSVVDADGPTVQPLLLSGPLYEAVESLPDVAIAPRFAELGDDLGLELTGDHRYAVHADEHSITVEIGVRYAPWLFPERVAELRAALTGAAFAAHPELARRVSDGRLRFEVSVRPGNAVAPYDSK